MSQLHIQHLRADIDRYLDSTIEIMVDKAHFGRENGRYFRIRVRQAEFTTEQIVIHIGFNPTTANRFLRQLTEFGYLEAFGGNRNRSYKLRSDNVPGKEIPAF